MDSERCQMYGMTTTAQHVSGSGIDVGSQATESRTDLQNPLQGLPQGVCRPKGL